ncbi:hypothetical protein BGM19_36350 [Streptomyces agglomeratus]|uniref:hypothetical protein n=1 Tax=Streptomyces agglomeratus TaxID=285458 RepID=UPI000868553D|nr:hypothetical protein [Streptomyces agglomeratus]OEJ62638.1 hypothetical protein BGM19_36350 [Streptomyces agglomeratus]
MDTARWLDSRYKRMWADEPHAVTAGLDATRHPGTDAYEAAQRKRGTSLHARLLELREQAKALDAQYHGLKDAEDEDGLLRLAGVLTATAANHDARAAVYDQLVTAEPSLSDEHRGEAEHHAEDGQVLRPARRCLLPAVRVQLLDRRQRFALVS